MKLAAGLPAILLVLVMLTPEGLASADDDGEAPVHQLSLADLAAYRDALLGNAAGNPATDARSVEVNFKDLWAHPDAYRGRRVSIRGRVVRTFRQGPVGTFPALVEVWITSPAGNPFCGVFPQPDKLDRGQTGSTSLDAATPEKPSRETTAPEIPAPGQTVEFTGTFLKIVRYTGADTTRLAPLIVGDQQPVRVSADADQRGTGSSAPANPRASQTMIRLIVWAVGLAAAAMVAFILARWHLRAPARSARRPTKSAELAPDLPLEFIEPHENP